MAFVLALQPVPDEHHGGAVTGPQPPADFHHAQMLGVRATQSQRRRLPGGPGVQVSSRTGTCYPSSRTAGSNSSSRITRSHIAPAGGFRLNTPPHVAASE
jgi:hypothetical protein